MKKAHQQQNKLWPELNSSGVWHTLHRARGEGVLSSADSTATYCHSKFIVTPQALHCTWEKTPLFMLSSSKYSGGNSHSTLIVSSPMLELCLVLTCPWRALVLEPCLYFGLILCLLLQSFSSAVLWIFCSANEILYFLSSPMQIWRKDCSLSLCIILYILESFMMFLSAFSQGKKAHLIQSFLTWHAS